MGRKGSSRGPKFPGDVDNYLVGFKQLMTNLNLEIMAIEGRTTTGMIRAVAEIRRETQQGAVTTPWDVGNLNASWFSVTATGVQSGRQPIFKDNPNNPRASAIRMSQDHTNVITESQGIVKSMTTKHNPVVMFGYSAYYSGYVHEMIGATFGQKRKNNTQSRNPGAQWLQVAIANRQKDLLKIIGDNARIKK